jgi:hypothetical protein
LPLLALSLSFFRFFPFCFFLLPCPLGNCFIKITFSVFGVRSNTQSHCSAIPCLEMEEKRERREKEKEEVEKKNSLFLSFFFGLFSLWLLFSFSRRRKKKKREQVRRGKKKERERASSRRLAGGDNGRSQSAARGLEGCARSPLVPEEGGHVDVRGAWGRGGRERERVRKIVERFLSIPAAAAAAASCRQSSLLFSQNLSPLSPFKTHATTATPASTPSSPTRPTTTPRGFRISRGGSRRACSGRRRRG